MRKVIGNILVALAVALASSVMSAAPATSLGSISGRAIDAAGRGVAGQRVDLMRGGQAIGRSVTDTRGSWSFTGVDAGEYVVRTSVNGTIAGMRVTVGTGQAVAGTTIVVPTSAVSPQFGALASIVANLTAAGATSAAAAVTAAVNPTEAVSLDADTVALILTQLQPEERQAFAQAVVQAIDDNAAGTNQEQASNIFVDVTQPPDPFAQPLPTNNFLQIIQILADTPPAQAPQIISIVVTAS
jgi:hypothetical protein